MIRARKYARTLQQKQGKWGRWRRVHVVAKGKNLCFGASETEVNAPGTGLDGQGVFKLTKATVSKTHNFLAKHAHQFELASPYVKKIEFYAQSARDMAEWIDAIQRCIKEANDDATRRARLAQKADGKRVDDHLLWASDEELSDDEVASTT